MIKRYRSYLSVITSAVLYALAFIYSQWLWWLAFIYAIPLLYAACMYKLTARHGFVWGLIFFSMQCAGLASSLYRMATGPWYMCIAPGIFFIVYMALYPMVLFGLLKFVVRLIGGSHVTTLALWVCGLCLMTGIIDRYCFIPLGTSQGYSFMNPLLPLALYPPLLRVVPYVGIELMIGVLLAVAAAVTACMIYRSWMSVWCAALAVLPWVLTLYVPMQQSGSPPWLSRIAVLPIIYSIHGDDHAAAQSVFDDLCTTVREHPLVDIVIMPESALPGPLTSQLCRCRWPDRCAPVQLIVGSNCLVDTRYSNCALWIAAGGQKGCFIKRRLIPPIEYMPRWCYGLQSLYVAGSHSLVSSDNERPCFTLDEMVTLLPYICSELFLSIAPDDAYTQVPMVVLVNDAWCTADYLVQCLFLCARFKAIAWQRDMIYASYYHAAWLSKTGAVIRLIRA
jgi:apolipoprotein N-acyltransferase